MNRKQFIQTLSVATAGAVIAPRLAAQEKPQATHSKKWIQPPLAASLPATAFPEAFSDGGWTLATLPDTQIYSIEQPDVYMRQTQWLAANKDRLNLRFVAHEGDIVHANTHPEWLVAKNAMNALYRAKIPYSLTTGNHDIGPWGNSATRDTLLNDYFTVRDYRYSKASGLFEKLRLENSWHKFPTPNGEVLVISLEFGPRKTVLEWANKIVSENPTLDVIVVTHAYMYYDGTRYDWANKGTKQRWNPHSYQFGADGDAADAMEIWEGFISKHANIRFVLSGHVLESGASRLSTPGKDGRPVHQILANYQSGVKPDRGYGGGGFMRLMRFQADKKTVTIKSYSPWYNQWLDEPAHDFVVTL